MLGKGLWHSSADPEPRSLLTPSSQTAGTRCLFREGKSLELTPDLPYSLGQRVTPEEVPDLPDLWLRSCGLPGPLPLHSILLTLSLTAACCRCTDFPVAGTPFPGKLLFIHPNPNFNVLSLSFAWLHSDPVRPGLGPSLFPSKCP